MKVADIEAELENFSPDELRQLALKSWNILMRKEGHSEMVAECDENNPQLLAALDEAVAIANLSSNREYSANQVRAKIGEWISK